MHKERETSIEGIEGLSVWVFSISSKSSSGAPICTRYAYLAPSPRHRVSIHCNAKPCLGRGTVHLFNCMAKPFCLTTQWHVSPRRNTNARGEYGRGYIRHCAMPIAGAELSCPVC